MPTDNLITKAAEIAKEYGGFAYLGRACGVSYQNVQQWRDAGRLPLPCLLGYQTYAEDISNAIDGEITEQQLLDWSRASWKEYYGVA